MSNTQIVYKLTDEHNQTYNGTQWGEGVTHTAPGTGDLCTAGWIHCYRDPLLAVLLNPIHADFTTPHLWEARAALPLTSDNGLKEGTASLTTLRELPFPEVTPETRVRFALLCGLTVYHEKDFVQWALDWLRGKDRSEAAAARAAAAEAAPLDLIALAQAAQTDAGALAMAESLLSR